MAVETRKIIVTIKLRLCGKRLFVEIDNLSLYRLLLDLPPGRRYRLYHSHFRHCNLVYRVVHEA